MDKLLYTLILDDIEKSNFQDVIKNLQKNHDENNKDYLYLRSYFDYKQKNLYLSLDTLIICITKFSDDFKKDGKFLSLLYRVLEAIKRFDLLNSLKNINERSLILEKLILWQNIKK